MKPDCHYRGCLPPLKTETVDEGGGCSAMSGERHDIDIERRFNKFFAMDFVRRKSSC